MADSEHRVYAFEDFQLDLARAELRRDGVAVPVEPKVFDLLAVLVGSHDRVVSRDEIIERVWSGRIISESAIAARINAARKALGDDGTAQRLIRTVHGRGFRFCLEPTISGAPASDAAAEAPHSRNAKPSIAVLPFAVLSNDPEQQYFADGIAEDIINALSRFHDLAVIARNTSFTFRGQTVAAREIGELLQVKYVLTGSVRQLGARVRVTVELVDAGRDRQLWSERYDRELEDIFSVQDEITEKAVASIAPRTHYAEMASAFRKEAASLSDWEKVMRARWHMDKHSRADTDTALRILDEVRQSAPDLPIAHSTAALVHCHRMLNTWCDDPLEEIGRAEAAARRAVQLDAMDADAIAVMGLAAMFTRHFDEGLDRLAEATAKNPNLAGGYGFMATVYGCLGETEKTVEAYDRAIALSPMDPARTFWMAGKGIALYLDRQYEACVENADQMLRIQTLYGPALRQKAASLAMLDRPDEAHAVLVQILAGMPNLTVDKVAKMVPVRDPADQEHWLSGLRKAGVPD